MIVSPYAKANYVSHVVHDHTSVLKLIETKWNLPALTYRDANADNLLDSLDFTSKPAFHRSTNAARPGLPAATAIDTAAATPDHCTPGNPGRPDPAARHDRSGEPTQSAPRRRHLSPLVDGLRTADQRRPGTRVDGAEGDHWATHAERYDAATAEYATRISPWAPGSPRASRRSISVAATVCRRGTLAGRLDGRLLGVDLSSSMLNERRAGRTEGLTNVEFLKADAQVHRFGPGTFDVAISRFGVMFFADPVAAFSNIAHGART